MSEWRRAVSLGKRDANEAEIVEAFKAGGANVARLSANGLPDLLVSFLGVLRLVEVKRGRAQLRASQEAFKRAWSDSPIYVIRTAPQARRWLKTWAERANSTRIVFPHDLSGRVVAVCWQCQAPLSDDMNGRGRDGYSCQKCQPIEGGGKWAALEADEDDLAEFVRTGGEK